MTLLRSLRPTNTLASNIGTFFLELDKELGFGELEIGRTRHSYGSAFNFYWSFRSKGKRYSATYAIDPSHLMQHKDLRHLASKVATTWKDQARFDIPDEDYFWINYEKEKYGQFQLPW